MKKVYLMALAAFFGTASMAQVSVTFQVDMSNETVSPNGVHVAGNWQDEAGFSAEWQPGESQLTDDDADDIYTLTVDIPVGEYEYKFINDNDWPGVEIVPGINQRGGGNDNRVFVVTDWHADNGGLTLPAITFGGSSPEGQVAVRLSVDMSVAEMLDPAGVHVVGNFPPQFTPNASKMWNVANDEYVYVVMADEESTVTYKFINGDSYATAEWADTNPPLECTDGLDRTVDVTTEDISTDLVCFEQCGPCTQPVSVTFRVNMELETVSENGVHVAGSWQSEAGFSADWQPGESMMTDDDSDNIYELQVMLPPGTYEYKYINGNDWGFDESVASACNVNNNRELEVVEEMPLVVTRCYTQCTEECVTNPDPAEITFRVNMNADTTTVSPDGLFMIGGFTDPAWQDGATPMTDDDGDGIYEATLLVSGPADIQYKFVNGDVNETANEESGDFEAAGCGVSNGLGGFNRTHIRSGEPETLPAFVYNACTTVLSVEEAELGRVAIYPNPSEGVSFLEIENPNNHTLRMHIVDITGKVVGGNEVINSNRFEINTTDLNAGLYFLNIVNERNERAVYKLMVK